MIKGICIIMPGLVLWTIGLSAQQVALPANLNVPAGNQLFLHVYAKGLQAYRCTQDKNDTSKYVWTFVEPDADLFTTADYSVPTGKHYAGPTWESNDGSKVKGKKLQQADAADPTSVPWLLLSAAEVSGSGIFSSTTFIQRVNTHGGNAPPIPAGKAQLGTEVDVSYTAEYLFYRKAI